MIAFLTLQPVKTLRENGFFWNDLNIFNVFLWLFGSQEHKDLHVGDDNQMTVRVVVENKAQDAAYPGRVIVTFPSIIDYASSSEVSWSYSKL